MSTTHPRVTVVVGNPKPRSRTLTAATYVASELAGREPELVVDLADLGPALLDFEDAEVTRLVERVGSADIAVVASPTYKAGITGLLKLFFDRFPPDGFTGIGVPLMLGAGPTHALVPEYALRPVLTELGALTPVRGLYVLDVCYDDPSTYEAWLAEARPIISALRRRRDDPTGVLV